MMKLSATISQNLSLQLSTSIDLDRGLEEVHEMVKQYESKLDSGRFLKEAQAFLLRSNRKGFFTPGMQDNSMLKSSKGLLDQAIKMALQRHRGEYRDSGHLYLAHVLSTGFVLARLGFPTEVVLSGILHDSVEDKSGKNQILNQLYALHPAIAWYVLSLSAQDIKDSVEKDKLLFAQIHNYSAFANSLYPKAIKCSDSIANLYDLEDMVAKDGRTARERQLLFLKSTLDNVLPYAREIDHSNLIPIKKGKEIFSLEEYLGEIISEKRELAGKA